MAVLHVTCNCIHDCKTDQTLLNRYKGHTIELAEDTVTAEKINQPYLLRIEQTHKEPILLVHLMILPKKSIARWFCMHNGQKGRELWTCL